jgi:Fur family peroxide stress response transcriptional regulator
MKTTQEAIHQLRQAGHKITPQRREILHILEGNTSHPTAEAVFTDLQATMPDASLATVYNTLNELVRVGLVHMLETHADGAVHFDPNTDEHAHLVCRCCGRIVDLEVDPHALRLSDAQANGFQVFQRQLTYYGTCPDCQDKNSE